MKSKARRSSVRDEDPILGVGAVVYRPRADGAPEVLLIRKLDGYWTLPKGKLQPGEAEPEALLREVTEETGISGEVGQAVRTVSYATPRLRPPRRKRVTFYLFRATSDELDLSRDEGIVDARWLPLRAAQQRVHRKRVRRVLRDASALLRPQAPRPASPEPAEPPLEPVAE